MGNHEAFCKILDIMFLKKHKFSGQFAQSPFPWQRVKACGGIEKTSLEYNFCENKLVGGLMKRSIKLWQLMGFAVTSLGGTVLHFLYDWLGKSAWIAPFSGVNESTWEHMKLLFWPMFLYAIVQRFFFREREDFWRVKLCGILLGLALIPIIFYTYNGVIGRSPDWINIAIFFVCAAVSYIYETRLFHSKKPRCGTSNLALGALLVIALLFVVFTFRTPALGIFKDPLTGTYGI